MAYNDLKTAVNGTFTTQASAASSDLAGVVAGADVLATQFDSLKSTVDSLSTVLNQLVNGQFTVLADSVSASTVTASEGQLYFETDTNTLSVYDGAAWNTVSPSGLIAPYVGTSAAPAGWLLCNGDPVPNGSGTVQSQALNFAVLYGLLSTSYGAAGTLPDLRGRAPFGYVSGSTQFGAFSSNEGTATASSRSTAHAHTTPDHAHSNGDLFSAEVRGGGVGYFQTGGSAGWTSNTRVSTGGPVGDSNNFNGGVKVLGSTTGSGVLTNSTASNPVPYVVTNYIIKV